MRTGGILIAMAALALAGCGGGSGDGKTDHSRRVAPPATASTGVVTGKLPPGAVEPADPAGGAGGGPGRHRGEPGGGAEGPEPPASSPERTGPRRSAAVSDYIRALDRHDAARVCAPARPGRARPQARCRGGGGGCRPSLPGVDRDAAREAAVPAWRKTTLVAVKPEDLGDDRARISATVTHHFSDRKYVSVEDDVIYLQRLGGRWLLAKPSATLYRAVGYPDASARRVHSAARLAASHGGRSSRGRPNRNSCPCRWDRSGRCPTTLHASRLSESRGSQASPR